MSTTTHDYCQACGHRNVGAGSHCSRCGATRARNRARVISGTAFILNELHDYPLDAILTAPQRARIETHYENQLSLTLNPQAAIAASAPPSVVSRHIAPPIASRQALPAPPRAPAPPRPEFDWSWLAEQQANLFLFAGAFLTVVAALIYVGYSGQAVSGALKMVLLVGYTFAFIAAGAICLRYERVAVAGRVFFAIGAIVVPLNFVAARSFFGQGDLSAQSMWLSGSIVAAAFYTAVSYLGLGRPYAFGAGVALASGVLASAVVADVPVEWMPVLVIALASAMSLTSLLGPENLRSRIGVIWSYQADALAVVSALFAFVLAPFARDYGDSEVYSGLGTAWFLPIALLAFTSYAAVQMTAASKSGTAVAAIAGFAAAFVATGFAADIPGEHYAVVLALLATTFGGIMLAAASAPGDARLPARFDEMVRVAAIVASGFAVFAACVVLNQAADEASSYAVGSRWFLPATFAALIPFYAIDAFIRRERVGAAGLRLAVSGVVAAILYTFDVSPEYYAFALILTAAAFAAVARWARHPLLARLHDAWREDTIIIGYLSVASGLIVGVLAAIIGADENSGFEPAFRPYLALAFAAAVMFAGIDASRRSRIGAVSLAAMLVGLGGSVAYAIDPSAEMYAFCLFVPAILIATAVRFAPESRTNWLAAQWTGDAIIVGRVAAVVGVGIAMGALGVSEDGTPNTYEPATLWFLPLSFASSAIFFALDASRGKRIETSAALFATAAATAISIPYALQSPAEHYAITLAATAFAFAAGGRLYTPHWIDETARDVTSSIAITASWLLFEGRFADAPRYGAAIHFSAALFYAGAALTSRSTRTFNEFLQVPKDTPLRLAGAWLYPAGLTGLLGYINVLDSLPASEDAEGGTMAMSLTLAAVAFSVAGAAMRLWRPEFRIHLYLMSLLIALVSLATGATPGTMSLVLAIYVAIFAALAVYEDQPLLGAPAILFGFAAVATYREHLDAGWWTIPASYSASAVIAGSIGAAVSDRKPWMYGLGAASGLFALGAPIAGFGILQSQVDEANLVGLTPFWETALYQWSTISIFVLGALALAAPALTERRWIVVPATATLTIGVLFQIGVWNPDNAQAYTAVIGTYLVLLGLVGLWKFRLIPEFADAAPFLEALGAAVIMFPSFVQSIDAGWRYQWILLAEAVGFFAVSVGLHRRGMLAAALVAMVLVAGRTLFDAVNALPNWIVVLAAGVALLAIGMGILLGRERWSRWQEALLGWWQEAGDGHSAA